MTQWFKRWFLDGWLTVGPQIGCPANQVRSFARCTLCGRVFPHWNASLTAKEAKARGFLGCQCGSMHLQPCLIPAWQSVWWFVIRGWLIRNVLFRRRLWDPRMPVLEKDLA